MRIKPSSVKSGFCWSKKSVSTCWKQETGLVIYSQKLGFWLEALNSRERFERDPQKVFALYTDRKKKGKKKRKMREETAGEMSVTLETVEQKPMENWKVKIRMRKREWKGGKCEQRK